MAATILNIVLMIIGIYLCCGLVFAIPFVMRGAGKIDEGTLYSIPEFSRNTF